MKVPVLTMYNSQNTMEGLRGQTNVHVNGRYSINRPGSEEDDERTSLLSSDSYTYSQVEDANETREYTMIAP